MAVTKEQILSAADQLATEGLRPTLEAVRQITGGSYSTISPVLNEWKARQAAKATPLREPVPQAIADRLSELGVEVWAVALDMANSRLAAERESLEHARAELEVERTEATELADRLADQVEELRERLNHAEKSATAAQEDAIGLKGQLAVALEQAHTAEARAAELRTELDRAHHEAEQSRQALTAAREEAAVLRGRLEASNEQMAILIDRLAPADGRR